MTTNSDRPTPTAWARFRFSVVGSLLSSPPAHGELKAALEALAGKTWTHPAHGREVHFSAVTIERRYYKARREKDDPVGVLRRALARTVARSRCRRGWPNACLRSTAHKHWTYQLHYDNLVRRPRPTLRWGRQVRTPPSGGTCRPTAWSASRGRPRALPARSARPGGGKSGRSAATRRSTSGRCGTSTSTTARSRCSRPAASGRSRWPWASSTTARGSAATCSGICRKPPRT